MNINTKDILDGLSLKRASIESERVKIDADFQRVMAKKLDLEERLSALDRVIREFGGDQQITVEVPKQVEEAVNSSQLLSPVETAPIVPQKRRRGLMDTGRKHFDELPNEYTKRDVANLLLNYHPELNGVVNENSLRNVVIMFVNLGLARIKSASIGKGLQVYEKIEQIA